jgi:hypothetical protein
LRLDQVAGSPWITKASVLHVWSSGEQPESLLVPTAVHVSAEAHAMLASNDPPNLAARGI